jgi:hypothetical protein
VSLGITDELDERASDCGRVAHADLSPVLLLKQKVLHEPRTLRRDGLKLVLKRSGVPCPRLESKDPRPCSPLSIDYP